MEDGRHSSGYMRPSSSNDDEHSKLSGASPVASGAAGVNPPDVEALSLGIWRPWGVGLSLRLSDVFEVIFSAFLTPIILYVCSGQVEKQNYLTH